MKFRGFFRALVLAMLIIVCAGGVARAASSIGPEQTAVVYTPVPPPYTPEPSPAPTTAAPTPIRAAPSATPTPPRAPASEESFDMMFYIAVGCAALGVVLLIVAIAMPKRRRAAKRKRR